MVSDEDPFDFVVRLRLPFMSGDLLVQANWDGGECEWRTPWDEWGGVKA